jgi:predicted DNA-binding protein (MmcQ/YjbR family)
MDFHAAAEALRAYALSLPAATEEFPWGESVIKVQGKVFVFLGRAQDRHEGLGMSVKLPKSKDEALAETWVKPTGYGLGRSGWVSAHWTTADPPVDRFKAWITESYRAVAPKRLAARV